MMVPAHILQQALELYLQAAYPAQNGGVPASIAAAVAPIRALSTSGAVSLDLLEKEIIDGKASFALRLGQPVYPHMKIVIDPVPLKGAACHGWDFLIRVDAHDRHLHAPAGSPDAAWLATVRQSNQALVEKIEAAWAAAGLPTFKEYLREQLERRRHGASGGAP